MSRLPEDVIYLLQAAAVAGPEFDADIVAEAAELNPEQRLDALDRAEESRLIRRIGRDSVTAMPSAIRWCVTPFTASSSEGAGSGTTTRSPSPRSGARRRPDMYLNELAHHFYMGAVLADADKASNYCRAAGERALRLLAFEEAAVHFANSLEVAASAFRAVASRDPALIDY